MSIGKPVCWSVPGVITVSGSCVHIPSKQRLSYLARSVYGNQTGHYVKPDHPSHRNCCTATLCLTGVQRLYSITAIIHKLYISGLSVTVTNCDSYKSNNKSLYISGHAELNHVLATLHTQIIYIKM